MIHTLRAIMSDGISGAQLLGISVLGSPAQAARPHGGRSFPCPAGDRPPAEPRASGYPIVRRHAIPGPGGRSFEAAVEDLDRNGGRTRIPQGFAHASLEVLDALEAPHPLVPHGAGAATLPRMSAAAFRMAARNASFSAAVGAFVREIALMARSTWLRLSSAAVNAAAVTRISCASRTIHSAVPSSASAADTSGRSLFSLAASSSRSIDAGSIATAPCRTASRVSPPAETLRPNSVPRTPTAAVGVLTRKCSSPESILTLQRTVPRTSRIPTRFRPGPARPRPGGSPSAHRS